MLHSKASIIQKIHNQYQQQFNIDLQAKNAIVEHDKAKIVKLQRIEAQINKINEQNQEKIRLLNNIENGIINKIEQEMKRDKQIEQKILQEYQKMMKEAQQVTLTQQVKKLREKQDWILLEQEQKRIEALTHRFQKRQLQLGRDMSLQSKIKRNTKEDPETKVKAKTVKKERRKKNV